MPARPLDGRRLAERLQADLAAEVADLREAHGRAPGLAVVLVGDDPASKAYVRGKRKACARVGIDTLDHLLEEASEEEVVALVEELNADPRVDGILVQLPLPAHIDASRVLRAVDPRKDVDAFHPQNVGHALLGREQMAPCTPQGILLLLDDAGIQLRGAEVVIVNHSDIVGKPLAALCINRDATVTVCHKHTQDLAKHMRRADVLVTATGVVGLVGAKDVKPGAAVVDVSMNRLEDGTLTGDCNADVWDVADWVAPVPGGVGPMTVTVLLQNTVRAYRRAVGAS